jgi:hypothetical protein
MASRLLSQFASWRETKMEAAAVTTEITPCGQPLPELEVPMINTIVMCLGNEHSKLNERTMQLALTAKRLFRDPNRSDANQRAVETWEEIQRDLWPHLQVEDSLLFSWGRAHRALPGALLDSLKMDRLEMRKLVAALPRLSSGNDHEPKPGRNPGDFARTLIALALALDSHIERFDREVLPSILRALFNK